MTCEMAHLNLLTFSILCFLVGDPGTGKTECLIHACYNAALEGAHVLIMCPTGTPVHAYRDRVPEHPNVSMGWV